MSTVILLSGGIDSCLMSVLTKEAGVNQKSLFFNYGQLNCEKEYAAAVKHSKRFDLSQPIKMDISGFGQTITSGLTDQNKHIIAEAFLPGRNMLFLLIGSAYAFQNNCKSVSIGLLKEDTAIFPDQTDDFIISAENAISKAMGKSVEIVTPLRDFYKSDVVSLAKEKGIYDSYSCHAGKEKPCGNCISCLEFQFEEN